MAIFEIEKKRKLKDKNYDASELMKTFKANEIANNVMKDLKVALKKGLNYYVWVCPYSSEIENKIVIQGGFNEAVEIGAYYLASDEI